MSDAKKSPPSDRPRQVAAAAVAVVALSTASPMAEHSGAARCTPLAQAAACPATGLDAMHIEQRPVERIIRRTDATESPGISASAMIVESNDVVEGMIHASFS